MCMITANKAKTKFPQGVIAKLRDMLALLPTLQIYSDIVRPRDQVFARFQPMFLSPNLAALKESEFRDFLHYESNHHWTGLHRSANSLCADMDKLKESLQILLDESRPVESRLDEVSGRVKGLGKATMTAILQVAHPKRYGVWNNTSDAAMITLRIYPEFERGESFGSRYVKINQLLLDLADELQTDLWTLDALWWRMDRPDEISGGGNGDIVFPSEMTDSAQYFGLERHLHLFIRDNWKTLSVARDWNIYTTAQDDEGKPAGYEYPCAVGRIDILGKHISAARWLVIEVKRGQTNDVVVGQLSRYMGWVKRHLAESTDEVHGMIIAKEVDEPLKYAASAIPNVLVQTYRILFTLESPPPLPNR
jgi:Endonuclease NucS